jgi:hypothetical protein
MEIKEILKWAGITGFALVLSIILREAGRGLR